MNRIKYLFTKLRLHFVARRALLAKSKMESAIKNSNHATESMSRRYQRFLSLSAKREQIAVSLKRITRKKTNRPILKVNLDIGAVTVSPNAENAITKLDIEMALARHKNGDWGDVTKIVWLYNNESAQSGSGNILSRYSYFGGDYFTIKTDLKRKTTSIQLEEINEIRY